MANCFAHPGLVEAYLWAVEGAATLLLRERFDALFPMAVRCPMVERASLDDMTRCLVTKEEKELLDEEFSVSVEAATGEGCWSRAEARFYGRFGAAIQDAVQGMPDRI